MREKLLLLTILLAPAIAFSQADTQNPTQDVNRPAAQAGNHTTITGCLTSGKHHDYHLKDESGATNIVYSPTVDLASYVGQSVTLVGDRDTSQGTDTGTGRPAAHFKVYQVQPASGNCK
jgi:hypothetical protein